MPKSTFAIFDSYIQLAAGYFHQIFPQAPHTEHAPPSPFSSPLYVPVICCNSCCHHLSGCQSRNLPLIINHQILPNLSLKQFLIYSLLSVFLISMLVQMLIKLHINYCRRLSTFKKFRPHNTVGHWGHMAPNLSKETLTVSDKVGSIIQLFISRFYSF